MSRNKLLFAILTFIIGILFSLNLLLKREQPIKLLSVMPPPETPEVDLAFLPTLEFDQEPKGLSLRTNPAIDYTLRTEGKTATLHLNQPLQPKNTYSLIVLINDKKIFSWSFTTRELSEAEGVLMEMETGQQSYPLAEFLPYKTEEFEIAYEDPLYLLVTLKKGETNTVKQKVLDWLAAKDVDPNSHRIEWVTPEP